MGALSTMQTPIVDIPHLVGIPAPEHLLYQAVIVASIVPRMRVLEAVPVVSKNLFEEVPGRRSGGSHQAASLQSVGWWVRALFYHIPSLTSTPSAVWTRALPHFAHPCATGTAGQSQNGKSYAMHIGPRRPGGLEIVDAARSIRLLDVSGRRAQGGDHLLGGG